MGPRLFLLGTTFLFQASMLTTSALICNELAQLDVGGRMIKYLGIDVTVLIMTIGSLIMSLYTIPFGGKTSMLVNGLYGCVLFGVVASYLIITADSADSLIMLESDRWHSGNYNNEFSKFQNDNSCCGFSNSSDSPIAACNESFIGCANAIRTEASYVVSIATVCISFSLYLCILMLLTSFKLFTVEPREEKALTSSGNTVYA